MKLFSRKTLSLVFFLTLIAIIITFILYAWPKRSYQTKRLEGFTPPFSLANREHRDSLLEPVHSLFVRNIEGSPSQWISQVAKNCSDGNCTPSKPSNLTIKRIPPVEFWRLVAVGSAENTISGLRKLAPSQEFRALLDQNIEYIRKDKDGLKATPYMGLNIIQFDYIRSIYPELNDKILPLIIMGGDDIAYRMNYELDRILDPESSNAMMSAVFTRNLARFANILSKLDSKYLQISYPISLFFADKIDRAHLDRQKTIAMALKGSRAGIEISMNLLLNELTLRTARYVSDNQGLRADMCWYALADMEVALALEDRDTAERKLRQFLEAAPGGKPENLAITMPMLAQAAACVEVLVEGCERLGLSDLCDSAEKSYELLVDSTYDNPKSSLCNGDGLFLSYLPQFSDNSGPVISRAECDSNAKNVDENSHMSWLAARITSIKGYK